MEANEKLDLNTDFLEHMQTLLAVATDVVLFQSGIIGIEGQMQVE